MDFRFDIIYEYRWMFFYGALTTLGLTVVATAGGSVLGLLLALARLIHLEKAGAPMRALAWVLRKVSLLYVTLFRGTPLFVQIVIWSYVWFPFFVHPTDGLLINGDQAVEIRRSYGALIAGSLALIANSGAYICEIFRAGIQSIDRGQMEAARSLGLDAGPMSGFDPAKINDAFFPDGQYQVNLLINLGYGDASKLHPRLPRLSFEQASRFA